MYACGYKLLCFAHLTLSKSYLIMVNNMKFKYVAKKGVDEIIEGELEAASRDAAMNVLMDRNLFPVSIDELKQEQS